MSASSSPQLVSGRHYKKIVQGILQKRAAEVDRLVKQGADLSHSGSHGFLLQLARQRLDRAIASGERTKVSVYEKIVSTLQDSLNSQLYDHVIKGDVARAQLLSNAGADLYQQGVEGSELGLLEVAITSDIDCSDVITLLLDNDPLNQQALQSRRADGSSLYDLAKQKENENVTTLIYNRLGEALLTAAAEGDVDAYCHLRSLGVSANHSSKVNGETSLLAAVRRGQRLMVEQILSDGVALEAQGVDGRTVLEICNDPDSVVDEGVKKLIEKYAKTRQLHDAVCQRKDTEEIARLIVEEGCNVNGRDGAGNTPLILAVHEGLEELVHYLLSVHAADPNVRNHDGLSVIQIAIKCCNIGSLQMLLANSSANMKCKAITVIEFAQNEGSADVVEILADALNDRLWKTLEIGDLEQLTELHECGANMNRKGSDGLTPVCWAAKENNTELIEWLFHNDSDINMEDEGGRPPVGHAATAGHLDSLIKLGTLGADTDKPDINGDSPLALAVAGGHVAVARYLISSGSDLERRNAAGKTPLEVAQTGGQNDEMEEYITSLQFDKLFEGYSEESERSPAPQADLLDEDITCSEPANLVEVEAPKPMVFKSKRQKKLHEFVYKVRHSATGRLLTAASKGNSSGVMKALHDGADACHRASNGRTALEEAKLILAGVNGDMAIAVSPFWKKQLIRKKAAMEEVIKELETHIQKKVLTVVEKGTVEELQSLHGISPNSLSPIEGNPLGLVGLLAANQDNVEMMDYIVRADTDKPVLMPTAVGANAAALEMCNEQGVCPCTLAKEKGNIQVANYIMGVLSVKLSEEVKSGNYERVEILLQRGARPVYQQDGKVFHSILDAVRSGNEAVVGLLIRQGAGLQTDEGLVVDIAQELGHTSLCLFLEKEVRSRDLFAAAARGDFDEVKRLHRSGADLNARNYQGDTVTAKAIQSGSLHVVHYLVSHGGLLVHSNQSADGAMRAAQKTGNVRLCEYIKTKLNDQLKMAINDGDMNMMELLYKAGVDVDSQSATETALTLAVKKQGQEVVQWLMERGAEVNRRDGNGDYPLTLAAHKGDFATVSYLLEKCANRNVTDARNMKASDIAQQQGHHMISDLLSNDPVAVKQARLDGAAKKKSHAYTNLQLQEAVRKGQVQVIDEFVAEEYDRTEKMELCEQLLSLARRHGQRQIGVKLSEHLEDLKLGDSSLHKLTGSKQMQEMLKQFVESLSSLVARSKDAVMDPTDSATYKRVLDTINERNSNEREVLNEMDSASKLQEQYKRYHSDLEKDLRAIEQERLQMKAQQEKIQKSIEEYEEILAQSVAPQKKVEAYDELKEMRQQMNELKASHEVLNNERKRREKLQAARDKFKESGGVNMNKHVFFTTVCTMLESVLISSKAAAGGMVSVAEKIYLLGVAVPFRAVDVVTGFLTRTCSKLQRSRTSHVARGIACLATASEMGSVAEEAGVRLTLWYSPQIDMVTCDQTELIDKRKTLYHPVSQLAEYTVGCIVDFLYDTEKHFTAADGLAEQFVEKVALHEPRRLRIFRDKLASAVKSAITTNKGPLPLHEIFQCSGICTSNGDLWSPDGVNPDRFPYAKGTEMIARKRNMRCIGHTDEPQCDDYMASTFLGETGEGLSDTVRERNTSSTSGSHSMNAAMEGIVYRVLKEEKLYGGCLQREWSGQVEHYSNRSDAAIEGLDRVIHDCETNMKARADLTEQAVESSVKQQQESFQRHQTKIQSQLHHGLNQVKSSYEQWKTETNRFVSETVEQLNDTSQQVQQNVTETMERCSAGITDRFNAYCQHLEERASAVDNELKRRQRYSEALVQQQAGKLREMVEEQHRISMKQLESRYRVLEEKLKQSQMEQLEQLNKRQLIFEQRVEHEQRLQENEERVDIISSTLSQLETLMKELMEKAQQVK